MEFETYYQDLFEERWIKLREALLAPAHHTTLELGQPYHLDEASVWVAQSLGAKKGERVLDMCAAPGGKTLVLTQSGCELTANELSKDRRERLKRNLRDCLGEGHGVRVTGWDGSRMGQHDPDIYDAILLDAPCSSERHVIQSEKALKEWSPARPKQLAQRQYALLASALQALKPGGRLVYATCALDPQENDGVIAKAIKKKRTPFRVEPLQLPRGEATEHGFWVLPDQCGGLGPMYASLLIKEPS